MKKLSLILSIGFLSIFTGIMVFSAVHTKAQTTPDPLTVDRCAYYESGENKNIYNNPKLSTEQIMILYHGETNNTFNMYIRKMIQAQTEAAKNNSVDPNSLPPQLPNEPPAEGADPMKAFCVNNPDNYSTFCLAARLISNQEKGNGYIQYSQALDCRRGNLFETTQEETLYQDYGEALISGEKNEQNFTETLQSQKALEISARLEAIDREIKTAKRALDQTLAAYEELKTAWPMHKRYIEIYEDLVKYRDKMVELRHQIEEYPSKFIDATTTMCTEIMKKLLYTLGFLMFATAALHPVVTLGQDQFSKADEDVPFSTARLFSKFVETTGLNPNADWTTTFGEKNDKNVGKDLYLIVYNKTELQPQNSAAKETAGKYGLNQGELNLVMSGDYSVITDRKPGLRQEELQAKVLQIRDDFTERKEMQELKAQVKAQVEMNEMFANGDLSDSGFDLIHDLEIIEKLLFFHTSPIDIGSSYTSTNGPGFAQVGQAGGTEAGITGPDGTKGPGQVGQTDSALTETSGNGESVDSQYLQNLDLNPNACFADESYLEALQEFEENSLKDPNYKDGSARQKQVSDNGKSGTSQSTADDDFFSPEPEPDLSDMQPAKADDWSKDKLCNDVYCLQINYIEKPATSSYSNSDNCIACHVEKINDILKTVVGHTLAPSKAPGNLGESAQCKKAIATAFGAVSMNFYAVSMPVQTPSNDDLIFGTSIEDEWQNFCNDTGYFPFDTCKSPEEVVEEIENGSYELPPLLTDRATKQAISETPDGASQAEVAQRIQETVNGYENQSKEAATKLIAQRKTDESLTFFNPLLIEMDQMNYYFSKIQIVLHSLHEKVDGFPGKQSCVDLKNKKECE